MKFFVGIEWPQKQTNKETTKSINPKETTRAQTSIVSNRVWYYLWPALPFIGVPNSTKEYRKKLHGTARQKKVQKQKPKKKKEMKTCYCLSIINFFRAIGEEMELAS